jgi:hypothetical protein
VQHGAFGDETPTGPWSMQVRPDGVILLDQVPHPSGNDAFVMPYLASGHRFVAYPSAGWLQPHPDRDNNFCDPEAASNYQWSASGRTLTVAGVDKACADRDIVLVGTWHHV